MRPCTRGALTAFGLACSLGIATGASAQIESSVMRVPELIPVESPGPRSLSYSGTLTRVKYRQETRTREFYRPAGQEKGQISEHAVRQEYRVSVWKVPEMGGVLRQETLPLKVGAKVGEAVRTVELDKMPMTVQYMLPTGVPSSYFGEPRDDLWPTALVFPERAVKPGDTWGRMVAPTDTFEIPTTVSFEFLREVRSGGRLCAEIQMEAEARGNLPRDRGLATMKSSTTFLFDIRLGRVLHAKTRLFQSVIGHAREGRPPEKKKVEQTVEMIARI